MKLALPAVALVLLVACGGSDVAGPRTVVGEWELRTYAEERLPVGDLISEVLVIEDGGIYRRERTFRTGPPKTATGTWEYAGNAITLWGDVIPTRRPGSLVGDAKLLVEWDGRGVVSSYSKR